MSASRRRSRSSKSDSQPQDPPEFGAEDLEILEDVVEDDGSAEVDELDTLEAWEGEEDDDGRVRVEVVVAESGADHDVKLTVEITDTDVAKADVPDLVRGPLTACAERAGLRWKRVVVEFLGDVLVPSAAKAVVADTLAAVGAARGVVQRGMGDEVVHEGESRPELPSTTETVDGETRVRFATDKVDVDALAELLPDEIDSLAADADGKRLAIIFSGDAQPDMQLLKLLRNKLHDSGARRLSVAASDGDAHVLFDRDLEDLVVVRVAGRMGWDTVLAVEPGSAASDVGAALDAVLPKEAAQIADNQVVIKTSGDAAIDEEVLQRLVAAGAAAVAIESDQFDIRWPTLLELSAGAVASTLIVTPAGREDAAVRTAFAREIAGLDRSLIEGRPVTVAWPGDFDLDEESERTCIIEALGGLSPESVAYTFDGDAREPAWPTVITAEQSGDAWTVILDTDRARPVELARAVERRLPTFVGDFAGAAVTIAFRGEGAVSRSLRSALIDPITAVGPTRLEVDDRGVREVLLPRLLTVSAGPDNEVRIAAEVGGRSAEQVAADAARELADAGIGEGATVVLSADGLPDVVRDAVIGLEGVARVDLEGEQRVQIAPRLLADAERDGASVRLAVEDVSSLSTDDEAALEARSAHEFPARVESAGGLEGAEVTIVWPGVRRPYEGALARCIEWAVSANAASVRIDPQDGKPARVVWPEVKRTFVEVVGRLDTGEPPMTMLAIDATEGEADREPIVAALAAMEDDSLAGRRVLVVFRADEVEEPRADEDAVAAAVIESLRDRVAALLMFRGGGKRAKFEVVHSTLDAFAVGKKFFDPRAKR